VPDDGLLSDLTAECGGIPSKGESRDLDIEALTIGGRGLARPPGKVWFVAGGLPGDRVHVSAEREHDRYVEGRLVRVVSPSPARRQSPCPIQPKCGGCPWMPLAEESQRKWKGRLVVETLSRIGGVDPALVEEVRAGDRGLAYRNRVELSIGRDRGGRPAVGFHAAGSGEIVDVDRCLLQTDAANRVLAGAREFLLDRGREWVADEPAGTFRLALRSSSSGELLVGLWETSTPFPEAEAFAAWIEKRNPEVKGVVRIKTRAGGRGGARITPLSGRAWMEECFGRIRFRVPAGCFTQVNSDWSARLPALVAECAGDVARADVVDLYGGIGVHGLALAAAGARRVTICEADSSAVRCGRDAVRRAGVGGVRYVHAHVGEFVERRWPSDRAPRVVVANPPRAGMGKKVARALAGRSCERIVVVSCDPPTLARDLRVLLDHGFHLRRVVPVDLFPQTPHVETVALLSRFPRE